MLILALVYIISIGMVVGALASWAMNDLHNTTNFRSARGLHYSASGVMNVAIQSIRYATLVPANQAQGVATPLNYCWTPLSGYVSELTIDNVQVAVWCSTVENLTSANTRVGTFTACQSTLTTGSTLAQVGAAGTACAAAPLLLAVVTFDDYPPGGAAPLTAQCSVTCGQGTTLNRWVWAGSA